MYILMLNLLFINCLSLMPSLHILLFGEVLLVVFIESQVKGFFGRKNSNCIICFFKRSGIIHKNITRAVSFDGVWGRGDLEEENPWRWQRKGLDVGLIMDYCLCLLFLTHMNVTSLRKISK